MIKRIIGAAALAAAISLGGTAVAAQAAPAQTVQASAKRFTCPYYGSCAFTGLDLTGSGIFLNRDLVGYNNEFQLLDPNGNHPQSERNHSGVDMWVIDRAGGFERCILPGDYNNTGGAFGYGGFLSGHTNCTEGAPGWLQ